jgi:hypothetical protein
MGCCAQCGKDISLKRRGAEFCSDRCRKRRERGADPQIIADKPEQPTVRPQWGAFRAVAGPTLSPGAFHAATISDRDPKTERSAWGESEDRNRKMLS